MDLMWLGSHFVHFLSVGENCGLFLWAWVPLLARRPGNRGTVGRICFLAKLFAVIVIERRRVRVSDQVDLS